MKRLACLALLLAGCAAERTSERSQPADPKMEIARLEGRIDALLRERMGVAREEAPPPRQFAPAPAAPPSAAPPAPTEPPSAAPKPPEAARPESPQVAPAEPPPPSVSVEIAAAPAKSRRRPRRCTKMSEAAAEICDAAGRICRLSSEIGDADSARSCGRAQEDCRRSTDIAAGCQ
jgi:hypothetical protein